MDYSSYGGWRLKEPGVDFRFDDNRCRMLPDSGRLLGRFGFCSIRSFFWLVALAARVSFNCFFSDSSFRHFFDCFQRLGKMVFQGLNTIKCFCRTGKSTTKLDAFFDSCKKIAKKNCPKSQYIYINISYDILIYILFFLSSFANFWRRIHQLRPYLTCFASAFVALHDCMCRASRLYVWCSTSVCAVLCVSMQGR